MIYTLCKPKISELKQLAGEIRNFPITGLGIVQCAEHFGYGEDVVEFVDLFADRMVFRSPTDFIEHCRLLERLLKEEVHSPPEHLRSPQD